MLAFDRRSLTVFFFATLTFFSLPVNAANIYLTGEVRVLDAEVIYTPPSDTSPVVLRYYLAEGSKVKAGDVVVRIDPGQAATQVRQLGAQIEQTRSRTAKEIIELRVKALDAQRALIDAEAASEKANVDAAIASQYISKLDFDRYRSEKERSNREYTLKQKEYSDATAAIARRQLDASLEIKKLEIERNYQKVSLANAEQKATRSGVLVHGFDSWRGGRIDEGASSWPGQKIGEVIGDDGRRGVIAYALEPERRALKVKQSVSLTFDAFPDKTITGSILKIAAAPDSKQNWGDGRYFSVEISLPEKLNMELLSGMNVRVHIRTEQKSSTTVSSAQKARP
jgi:HlyD family secretion protein